MRKTNSDVSLLSSKAPLWLHSLICAKTRTSNSSWKFGTCVNCLVCLRNRGFLQHTRTRWQPLRKSWHRTCVSQPITQILAPEQVHWDHLRCNLFAWPKSTGQLWLVREVAVRRTSRSEIVYTPRFVRNKRRSEPNFSRYDCQLIAGHWPTRC